VFHKANRGSTFGRLEFCQAGENHAAQLFGQTTQCPAFGFQHLFFIGFEAGLRIAQTFDGLTMTHQNSTANLRARATVATKPPAARPCADRIRPRRCFVSG